jgi:hypothetical protein
MRYNNDFKYDLQLGQLAEKKIGDLLSKKKLEVKRDFKAMDTGNVYVEYRSRGKASGLTTTLADYYVFVISFDRIIFIATPKLKQLCRKYVGTNFDIKGGDSNTSQGILLSLDELING